MKPKFLALLETVRDYRQQYEDQRMSSETAVRLILATLEEILRELGKEE